MPSPSKEEVRRGYYQLAVKQQLMFNYAASRKTCEEGLNLFPNDPDLQNLQKLLDTTQKIKPRKW
jgi:hypothetical protein